MKKIILILLILIFPKLSFTYEEVDIKNYYNKIYKNTLKISWNNDYEAIKTIENILEIKKELPDSQSYLCHWKKHGIYTKAHGKQKVDLWQPTW